MNRHRTAAGFLGALMLMLLAGCPLEPPWRRYTIQYPDGIGFSREGNGPINRATWSRLDFSRDLPNETQSFECKWILSTPDQSFRAEDFEYEAFQAVGATVPVLEGTSKEDNHSTIRQVPLEGALWIEGNGYQIWCGYEDDRRLRHIAATVDYANLPAGSEGLSVSIGDRSVQLPCSVHRLKKRLGEPLPKKKGQY